METLALDLSIVASTTRSQKDGKIDRHPMGSDAAASSFSFRRASMAVRASRKRPTRRGVSEVAHRPRHQLFRWHSNVSVALFCFFPILSTGPLHLAS